MKKIQKIFIAAILMVAMVFPNVMYVSASGFTVAVSDDVIGGSPEHFVFEGGEYVSFTVSGGTYSTPTVTDYFGNNYDCSMYGNKITVSDLPYGYYELEIDNQIISFAVVPNYRERRDSSNSPIALGTHITHSSRENTAGDTLQSFVNTIKLAGVKYVREMLLINETTDSNGVYSEAVKNMWNTSSRYDEIMGAYADAGLHTQLYYHGFYEDLTKAYDYGKAFAGLWQDTVTDVEIDNEKDLTNIRPDKYAAYVKANVLGIEDSGSEATISVGGFSGRNYYINKFYQNDIKDYIDGVNYHLYKVNNGKDEWQDISERARNVYYSDAQEYGLANKNLWLNETNLQTPYQIGETELSSSQKKAMAQYMAAACVKYLANGMDKVFVFKHGYMYEDRGSVQNSYATFSQDNHPYPLYSVVAGITQALGNGRYYATIDNMPSGTEAHIFKEDKEHIAAVWSETQNTPVTFKVAATKAVLIDMFGNETPLEITDGEVNITAGQDTQFVRVLGRFTDSYTLGEHSEKKTEPRKINAEDYIVLNQVFPTEIEEDTTNNTTYNLIGETEMKLQVYNFGNSAAKCVIDAKVYPDWEISPQTQTVDVGAGSCEEVTFTLTPKTPTMGAIESALSFGGTVDGKPISKSVSYIQNRNSGVSADRIIENYKTGSKWSANKNPDTTWKVNTATSNSPIEFKITAKSSGDDSVWCFPYLDFGSFDLAGSDALVFEVKANKQVADVNMGVYIDLNDGQTFSLIKSLPDGLTTDFQTVYFSYNELPLTNGAYNQNGELDISKISKLRIGFNMENSTNYQANEFTMYMQNVGVHTAPNSKGNASIGRISYKEPYIQLSFNASNPEINGAGLKATLNGNDMVCREANGVYYIEYFEKNDADEIKISYIDVSGTKYEEIYSGSEILDEADNNSFSASYNQSDNPNHEVTLLAYDVTNIPGASASTEFIDNTQTPIRYINAGYTGGNCRFNLLPQYKGDKIVVQINNGNDEVTRMLLSVAEDFEGNQICKILQVSMNSSVDVYSWENNLDSQVIFAKTDESETLIKDARIVPVTFGSGNQSITFPQDFTIGTGERLQIFIWRSLVNLVPLTDSYTQK